MKILDWLNERKEFCIGAAEQAPYTVEAKHLISEARKYDQAERIIRAAEQLIDSKCVYQSKHIGASKIDQLEQLLKEIK